MKPETKPSLPQTFEIVKPKDLQTLFNLSYRSAVRRYNLIRDSIGKTPVQQLFKHEVLKFEGINL